jgi:catechol 2,3-dioxygenase-like lactoylglutathione lyase family enzyme
MSNPTAGDHHVRWCFHTTAMVADYERTRDALIRLVGLRVLEDSRIEDPAIGRRGGMAWVGDNIIEIGEPIVAGGAVDRFVERFGSHMSSIAVQVDDIDATVEFLRSKGVRIASRIDGHIVFTHPADTAGIVIEWFGHEEPLDPRFGAPMPPSAPDPVLEVTHMAFGGAVVTDPPVAATRLAALFGHGYTVVESASPGAPMATVSMGDVQLALYEVPRDEAESRRLWGWSYDRPQTSNLGVKVPDLGVARDALAAAHVPIQRDDAAGLVIAPDATGGVVLVVTDTLLDGDPRA